MSGQWFSGLQVRGLDRGDTPVADLLCTACWHHERVRGKAKVTDYLRANPLAEHRARCPNSAG
ncbi:transcription factor WhiB [Streptomyces nigra]|uniref:transcription factor WhiB n=1 Tax=Streptomyces nigra TaxID=1827580 RepID=UPI003451181B